MPFGKRSILGLVICGLLAWASPGSAEPLTNEDILKLCGAGVPASAIVAKIRGSESDFDTSVDALIALAGAEVPEEVITAMTEAGLPPAPAQAPAASGVGARSDHLVIQESASAAPTARANFSGTPCESPGIFVATEEGLTELEATTYSQTRTSSPILSSLTLGAKSTKSIAVLQGLSANFQLPGREPKFYFCFEESEAGLSYGTTGATNPREFVLVQFNVKKKRSQRELVVGKLSVYTGAHTGAENKAVRATTYEKLAPGVFEVTPERPLLPGEYGFYYAGSVPLATYGFMIVGSTDGGDKVFDFSVP